MIRRWWRALVDDIRSTSSWVWRVRGVAMLAAAVALGATNVAAGEAAPWIVWIAIALLTLAAVLRPDSHTASVVVGFIAVYWLAAVDARLTPWAVVAAIALVAFHAAVALAASCPESVELPGDVQRRWIRRTGLAAIAAPATWLIVVLFDARHARGNAVLTALGLAAVAACALALRARTLTRDQPR